MSSLPARIISAARVGFVRLEEFFLCFLLLTMIILASLQVFLRGFSGGMLWIDPLLRQLVIWAGMFGAAAATSRGKHISLDILTYLVPHQARPWLDLLNSLFAATVCVALTHAAIIFVKNEALYGGSVLLLIPSWAWSLVFPVSFGLISLRFFIAAVNDILYLVGKKEHLKTTEGPPLP